MYLFLYFFRSPLISSWVLFLYVFLYLCHCIISLVRSFVISFCSCVFRYVCIVFFISSVRGFFIYLSVRSLLIYVYVLLS